VTEAEQASVKRLLEKFGLSIMGEDRLTVFLVLAAFSREMCDRYGVAIEDFFQAVRDSKTFAQHGGGSA
jgi:hypothetical protein